MSPEVHVIDKSCSTLVLLKGEGELGLIAASTRFDDIKALLQSGVPAN